MDNTQAQPQDDTVATETQEMAMNEMKDKVYHQFRWTVRGRG
jgi:hypothetical protein